MHAALPMDDGIPTDVVLAWIDALLAHHAGGQFRHIRAPTLILAADDDVLVSLP